jgi:hypothetical protein
MNDTEENSGEAYEKDVDDMFELPSDGDEDISSRLS